MAIISQKKIIKWHVIYQDEFWSNFEIYMGKKPNCLYVVRNEPLKQLCVDDLDDRKLKKLFPKNINGRDFSRGRKEFTRTLQWLLKFLNAVYTF